MTDSRTTEAHSLLPCPFCGAGETLSEPDSKMWSGMEWRILSWRVRHWCSDKTHGSMLQVRGKTQQEAEERWNRRSAPGARDEDDAPELTADDFKRPSAKWNAPEPSESRTTSLLLSQAARLLREYADDAHAEDVPDVLRWLAVYEGRSTEPAGGHGNPCPLCKAHNLASCECPQEDHVDSVKVQPAFYRIQHKFDKGRFNDFSTDMWDLIIPGLPLTKEAKP